MEFEKYQMILEWEEANRPLSQVEKGVLTAYSIAFLQLGLRALERDYREMRSKNGRN